MDLVRCVQRPVVWREGVVCRIVEPIGDCEDNPDQAEDDEDKRPGFNAQSQGRWGGRVHGAGRGGGSKGKEMTDLHVVASFIYVLFWFNFLFDRSSITRPIVRAGPARLKPTSTKIFRLTSCCWDYEGLSSHFLHCFQQHPAAVEPNPWITISGLVPARLTSFTRPTRGNCKHI